MCDHMCMHPRNNPGLGVIHSARTRGCVNVGLCIQILPCPGGGGTCAPTRSPFCIQQRDRLLLPRAPWITAGKGRSRQAVSRETQPGRNGRGERVCEIPWEALSNSHNMAVRPCPWLPRTQARCVAVVGAATSQPSLTDPSQKMHKAGNRSDLALFFFFFSLFLPEITCGLTADISILASLGKRMHSSPRLPPPALPPPLAEGSAHDATAGEEAPVGTGCLCPPHPSPQLRGPPQGARLGSPGARGLLKAAHELESDFGLCRPFVECFQDHVDISIKEDRKDTFARTRRCARAGCSEQPASLPPRLDGAPRGSLAAPGPLPPCASHGVQLVAVERVLGDEGGGGPIKGAPWKR